MIPNTTPVFAVDEKNIIPVSEHLRQMIDIPPSRMFLINKSLKVYQERNPDVKIFDASQVTAAHRYLEYPKRSSNALPNFKLNMVRLMTCPSVRRHIAKLSSSNIGNWIPPLAGDL